MKWTEILNLEQTAFSCDCDVMVTFGTHEYMGNNKRTIRQMGLSRHMIPEHSVLLNIIRLEHEGSDGIVNQG